LTHVRNEKEERGVFRVEKTKGVYDKWLSEGRRNALQSIRMLSEESFAQG
jgi:hypothetical protein